MFYLIFMLHPSCISRRTGN